MEYRTPAKGGEVGGYLWELMGGESEALQNMMTKTVEGLLCHRCHRDNSTQIGFKAGFQITAACSFHSDHLSAQVCLCYSV